jgi:hypothetical protein
MRTHFVNIPRHFMIILHHIIVQSRFREVAEEVVQNHHPGDHGKNADRPEPAWLWPYMHMTSIRQEILMHLYIACPSSQFLSTDLVNLDPCAFIRAVELTFA